jgi:hypothetical protein
VATRGPESLWGYPGLRLSLWVGSWHGTGLLRSVGWKLPQHRDRIILAKVLMAWCRIVRCGLSRQSFREKQQSRIAGRSEGSYLAIQRIFHRTCTVGVARHSFPGVVVLAGALPAENERWNNAWGVAWSFPDQSRSRYCRLSGKSPPLGADRFLAGKFLDRNSSVGDL